MWIRDVNQYMMKLSSSLSIYCLTRLIAILAAAVLANHSPRTFIYISLNMKPSWLTCIGTQQQRPLVIILTDDAIKHTCIWPLAWCNKRKPYNSSTPLQQFLTFLFISQREREAMEDERTHHGAVDELNQSNWAMLVCQYSVLWETSWYSNI